MTLKRIPKHLIFDPQPKRRSKAWIGWLLITLVSIAAAVVVTKANATEQAPALPEAGSLTTRHSGGTAYQALHTGTQVNATIDGMVVSVSYTQRFRNTSEHWVEGIYTFPLPQYAAVQHMEMRIGERRIVGKIKAREEATRIYRQALSEGKQAALTVQQRPNLFTQRIANIAPGETIEVHLEFVDKVRYQQGMFEWRLPTTLTPRYMPGTRLPIYAESATDTPNVSMPDNARGFGWAHATSEVPDASWISPPMDRVNNPVVNPIGITISLTPGVTLSNVDSLYHDVTAQKNGDSYTVFLDNGRAEMDRDFVLQWRPTPSQEPRAALFKQTVDNEHYALFMLMPPTQVPETSFDRDITFIIDTSGSMQGSAIEQAKASMRYAIRELSEHDRFNIIAFSSDYQMLYALPQFASPNAKQQADNWVTRLDADGGTEMYPALEAAFAQSLTPERLQQVVFITDGAVGNEAALFSLIETHSENVRLFTVGIGSAPNSYFMSEAAAAGRGTYEYIAQSNEVNPIMQGLFTKLNRATTKDIVIDWPVATDALPAKSGDLYFGEPLITLAKSVTTLPAVEISGSNGAQKWERVVSAYQVNESQGIGALWAREKISALEASHRRGQIDDHDVRTSILEVALKHHLLSRFTAFVAVDEPIVRPAEQRVARERVRHQRALSQRLQAVPFPKTATSSTFTLFAGYILLTAMACLRGLMFFNSHRIPNS